jgi:hypothetical protein
MTLRSLLLVIAAALVPAAVVAMLAPPLLPPPRQAAMREPPGHPSPAYKRLIARHVRAGTIEGTSVRVVDYAAVPGDPDYRRALAQLAAARPETMGRDERLAFWINAYNLLAIRIVVERYPVESILEARTDHVGVWEMEAGTAAGRTVSLGGIEDTLRDFGDPRIHFALVAAAISCPDLRAYDGVVLDEQLDQAAREFLADEQRGSRAAPDGVEVSRLLHSYHEEFEPAGVVAFLRAHAPSSVAGRLVGMRLHDLGKLPYDWRLNDLARASVAVSP